MVEIKILLIVAFSLTPALTSLCLKQRLEARGQARLRAAIEAGTALRHVRLPPDGYYVEGLGYIIGDITCQFNSRSIYLRCALHPDAASCNGCKDYTPERSSITIKTPDESVAG